MTRAFKIVPDVPRPGSPSIRSFLDVEAIWRKPSERAASDLSSN